jgi:hypothetical protein
MAALRSWSSPKMGSFGNQYIKANNILPSK